MVHRPPLAAATAALIAMPLLARPPVAAWGRDAAWRGLFVGHRSEHRHLAGDGGPATATEVNQPSRLASTEPAMSYPSMIAGAGLLLMIAGWQAAALFAAATLTLHAAARTTGLPGYKEDDWLDLPYGVAPVVVESALIAVYAALMASSRRLSVARQQWTVAGSRRVSHGLR